MRALKSFFLQELHLSPSVYLDKFNALVRDKDETFGQFSTRLMSLFEYYVESRKVGHSYDKLVDLMVYDKIKASLSPLLAPHVLSLEALHKDLWLGRLALIESLDAYMANLADKPYGAPIKPIKPVAKFENGKRTSPSHFSTPDVVNKYGQKSQPMTHGIRQCFICSSSHHLAITCPQRATQGIITKGNMGAGAAQKPVARPRANACARSYGRPGRMTPDIVSAPDRTEQQPVNTAFQPVQKATDHSKSVVNHYDGE